MKTPSVLSYLLKILALAVVYRLGVVIGLSMAYVQSNTSPVWPPTGIALAALLLYGVSLWPGIALSVFLGSLLTGAPAGLAAGMAVGNTLEALAGYYLLRRVIDIHLPLDRIRDVVGVVVVSIFCTAISASFGTLSLMVTANESWAAFLPIWTTWWIGDFLGALVVAPFLLVWLASPAPSLPAKRLLESVAVWVALVFVTWFVFFTPPPAGIAHEALLYVIFPFTIWASLRLGQRGAATAVILVSGIAIWGTTQGHGPFAVASKNDSLILLQTFMAVVSLTSLILAAASMERRAASGALQHKVHELDTLNRSSEAFLTSLGQDDLYQTICQLAVDRFGVDAAWVEIADWETGQLRLLASRGIPLEIIPALKSRWSDDDTTLENDAPLMRIKDQPEGPVHNDFASYAVIPMWFGNRPLGLVKMLSRSAGFFNPDREILLRSFSNLAAIAIQNSWLLDRVRRGNEQLHALSQRLLKAQEEERLHLSRELHDESGQLLAAMMVQLGLLERHTGGSVLGSPAAGSFTEIQAHVKEMKRTTTAIQEHLHTMAVNLRPASLDHVGLVTALQQYIKEFNRQYDLCVEFEATGMEDRRLPPEMETAIFRIVQESLTNVVLHAQARRVDIVLHRQNGTIVTAIDDDGVGFNPQSPTTENQLGLFGMRERVQMLGGRLTIESTPGPRPGHGTTVKVEVPCDD